MARLIISALVKELFNPAITAGPGAALGMWVQPQTSPLDVLVGIVAAWVGRVFDGFDALGIDDSRRRLGILAYPLPLGRTHGFED